MNFRFGHAPPFRFALRRTALLIAIAAVLCALGAPARAQPVATKKPAPTQKPTPKSTPKPSATKAAAGGIVVGDANSVAAPDANAIDDAANAAPIANNLSNAAPVDAKESKPNGGIDIVALGGAFALGLLLMGAFHLWQTRAPKAEAVVTTPAREMSPKSPTKASVAARPSVSKTLTNAPTAHWQTARASAKKDALLQSSLALSELLLQHHDEDAFEVQQARADLLALALREADPHNLHKIDIGALESTLRMAATLDAFRRGVPLAQSKRVRPLATEAASSVEQWAAQLLDESGVGDELKREVLTLEKQLQSARRKAGDDASQIAELRADAEAQKLAHRGETEKLRERQRAELEELARDYARELAARDNKVDELTQVNARLQSEHREMSARIDSEWERGARQTQTELEPQLKAQGRYLTLARQQGELEKLTYLALERLFAASDNPALVASVGFLLGHCLRQLTMCVYLNEASRRTLALNGIASVAAGLDKLPAMAQLAQKARELGGDNALPTSNAQHSDRVLFGIALGYVRRNSAPWGHFPRHFDFDLDGQRAAIRVTSDD